MDKLVLLLLGGAVVFLTIAGERLGRKLRNRPKALKAFYRRLGTVAPDEPCVCPAARSSPRPYRACCRPKDVGLLEQEVRQFVWTNWMRRSGGRSRFRSMKHRLQDYPMGALTLPPWVTHPEQFSFPVTNDVLQAWTPVAPELSGFPAGGAAPSFGDDVPL